MNLIAIDIGGTMIKFGLVSEEGKILESGEIQTEAHLGLENILKKMNAIYQNYQDLNKSKYNFEKLLGLAVSGTGQIDGISGKVIGGNDIIPQWIGCNLVDILTEKYQLEAILENDVNCAALGEKWLGAGKDKEDFICLTIGTGIGGGLILNNDLYRGQNFVAAEFGHMKIRAGKEYEELASTTALLKAVHKQTGKNLNGLEIFNLEKNNISPYVEIIKEWIEAMTDGLASLIYIFNPKTIIIGGGVTGQGQYFLDKINASLIKKIGPNFKKDLEIKFAELGNNAGMLGASYLLLKKLGKI